MIAEIAVGLPIDKTFHYSVPGSLKEKIAVGKRVWVPFGQKRLVGYVVGFVESIDIMKLKDIEDVIGDETVLDDKMLSLTKWISEYYFCSWGEAIETALPATFRRGKLETVARKSSGKEVYDASSHLELTGQQENAIRPIIKDVRDGKHNCYLLFGITGSGKTELYIQAISDALKQGKSSCVLVPEISLTPQTTERFKSRFQDEVSVIHSRLSEGIRFQEWKRMNEGKSRIVIGPRSAVFSPLKNIGLIIIDEEHETSYKQEDSPRYHARDVAIKRAQLNNAVVVLGSATPSLESYHNAKTGKYRLIILTERIQKRQLPKVRVIDMRKELMRRGKIAVFSMPLRELLDKDIAAKKQAILFLNRRGFSTHLNCKKCGMVMKCKRCESVLVFHSDINKLVCHYCNKQYDTPRICPKCDGNYVKFFGLGTQKVESELHRFFPHARIARMDSDSTSKRGSHERILGEFKKGRIDIIIGTQMIAKGLDFPQVTLVGVVMADTSLNLPDFRASERTFDLLTQVAGRAGRGADPAQVIIQTYAPTHYAITSAKEHDYESFYNKEIVGRKLLGYPPFYKLIKVTFRSTKEEKAKTAAEEFVKRAKSLTDIQTMGPAPSMIPKVRGQFRWNAFLKFKSQKDFSLHLRGIIGEFKKGKGAFMVVDVDPMNIL